MADNEFSDFVELVKRRNNIVDVASKYVTLDKRGANYWACCPLHHETKPSFAINPERGTYMCYGCHEHGDVIKLVEELESCSFMDALTRLAERAGLTVPQFGYSGGSPGKNEKKERLYALMREAAMHYYRNLRADCGFSALEYLKARGIGENTMNTFGIGYSDGFEALIKHLTAAGFTREEMLESGVAEEKNGKIFDAQHDRLIIPIINKLNKVVAFGGRYLGDTDFAKYKNTRETLIFEKRNEIFGINNLKKLKIAEGFDKLIVVEGYMDVISLYQAGVKNVCASMGTALTPEQCKALKFLTDNVYLCYDGDSAGQKAALRGIDILRESGLNTRVIVLKDKLDPDDFIRKYGLDAFRDKIDSAISPVIYKFENLKSIYDISDPDGRSKYAIEALKIVAKLNNPVDRNVYLDILSEYTGIDKTVLNDQLISDSAQKPLLKKSGGKETDNRYTVSARFVLYSLYSGAGYTEGIKLYEEYFKEKIHREIYAAYRIMASNNEIVTPDRMYDFIEDENEIRAIIEEAEVVKKDARAEYYKSAVTILKKEYFEREKESLNREYLSTDDRERKANIIRQIAELNREMRNNIN